MVLEWYIWEIMEVSEIIDYKRISVEVFWF